jgi:hypothetical protein
MSEKIYTIEEIKSILNEILKNTQEVSSVTLFGSYAKHTASKNSDLDFIIDTNGTLIGFKLYDLITEIEDAFNKKVDAFEKVEIVQGSKIDEEIEKTGIIVYEK